MQGARLMIAQVDHATGEVIGHSIQTLYDLGAKNVQLLQSMTKKNRPGYLLFIDLPAEAVEDVALFLGTELGIWGYHILQTEHVHFDISFHTVSAHLVCGENHEDFPIKVKYIANATRLMRLKVDHDQLVALQRIFTDWNACYPLDVLRTAIEAKIWEDPSVSDITVTAEINKTRQCILRVT